MLKIYKKYEEIIKYLIFGFLTTLVSILTYIIFTRVFNLNYNMSNVLSWILAVTFAFFTNKTYVFKSNNNLIKEVINFFISRLSTLVIEIILMFMMIDIIKINDLISKLFVQVLVIVLNYIFSKLFVFSSKKN